MGACANARRQLLAKYPTIYLEFVAIFRDWIGEKRTQSMDLSPTQILSNASQNEMNVILQLSAAKWRGRLPRDKRERKIH